MKKNVSLYVADVGVLVRLLGQAIVDAQEWENKHDDGTEYTNMSNDIMQYQRIIQTLTK